MEYNQNKLRKNEIKQLRMNLGKFLLDYYVKFGEEKYEKFLEKLGSTLEAEYGEPFSSENMRIMEAEFVTLSATIRDKSTYAESQGNIKQ